ncbi:MAG: hypothetical protein ACXABN_18265, partial [Candidatus Thorarchaeota archaeon]
MTIYDTLTLSTIPPSEQPGPTNTGYRLVGNETLTDWENHEWYMSADGDGGAHNILQSPFFDGKTFSKVKFDRNMKLYASGVEFIDCLFTGSVDWTPDASCVGTLYGLNIGGDSDLFGSGTSGTLVSHCTFRNLTNGLVLSKGPYASATPDAFTTGTIIEYCDIGGGPHPLGGGCIEYSDGFSGIGDRICKDAMKLQRSCIVRNNWIHDLGYSIACTGSCKPHSDGIQSTTQPGGKLLIQNNNFDMPVNTYGGDGGYECGCQANKYTQSNACILVTAGIAQDSYCTLEIVDNWLNGGNYTIGLGSGDSYLWRGDITVSGNEFGRDFRNMIRNYSKNDAGQFRDEAYDFNRVGNTMIDSSVPFPDGDLGRTKDWNRRNCQNFTGDSEGKACPNTPYQQDLPCYDDCDQLLCSTDNDSGI